MRDSKLDCGPPAWVEERSSHLIGITRQWTRHETGTSEDQFMNYSSKRNDMG